MNSPGRRRDAAERSALHGRRDGHNAQLGTGLFTQGDESIDERKPKERGGIGGTDQHATHTVPVARLHSRT